MYGRWKYYTRDGVLKSEVEYDGTGSRPKVILLDEYKLKPGRDSVYYTLNHKAQFGNDSAAVYEYITSTYRLPEKAMKKGIDSFGMVWHIVIDKDGSVVRASRISVSPKTLDRKNQDRVAQLNKDYKFGIQESFEAFLKNMPKWTPGSLLEKPVRSGLYLEVNYKRK